MYYDIKYNDKDDEFIGDLTLQMRIERYIKEHFYPAKTISTLLPIYLVGGGIRDLMNAKHPKDLDFVVLGSDKEWIEKVFEAFKIVPRKNKFGGYKFEYNGTTIDLWLTEDLFSSIQYNVDGLFYDIRTKRLVSLTYNDFQKNGLKLVNEENNIENGRILKLRQFEQDQRKENTT